MVRADSARPFTSTAKLRELRWTRPHLLDSRAQGNEGRERSFRHSPPIAPPGAPFRVVRARALDRLFCRRVPRECAPLRQKIGLTAAGSVRAIEVGDDFVR